MEKDETEDEKRFSTIKEKRVTSPLDKKREGSGWGEVSLDHKGGQNPSSSKNREDDEDKSLSSTKEGIFTYPP